MSYHPRTPFRRAYDAARLKDFAQPTPNPQASPVDKWEVLRELGVARKSFELSDRTLTVLQALLSFHQDTVLSIKNEPPIIYPANATICARLNGMPCSTMRRHLASLIKAGFLIRRDSPNGKRFKRSFGSEQQAFGFDLTPLVIRYEEIRATADIARAEKVKIDQLRLNTSLMLRDLTALSELAKLERAELEIWNAFEDQAKLYARELRRKLNGEQLELLTSKVASTLAELQATISTHFPEEMSSTEAQNEQHHHNSIIEIEDENLVEKDQAETGDELQKSKISLAFVRSNCLEIGSYFSEPLNTWSDLIHASDRVRPMMGISSAIWKGAVKSMGIEQAAIVIVAMLERFGEIRSPNGYLRHLTSKAEQGKFTCNPMLLAISRRRLA
ncbi:plasmid replication protein RepC [Planktotalea sp.]|uniref:plasmid replication protein RepC n=1 Tax=Planktotalea sp. TaxID=2029877 RepID=UPI003D6A30B5